MSFNFENNIINYSYVSTTYKRDTLNNKPNDAYKLCINKCKNSRYPYDCIENCKTDKNAIVYKENYEYKYNKYNKYITVLLISFLLLIIILIYRML
jgi:hypothetical protein